MQIIKIVRERTGALAVDRERSHSIIPTAVALQLAATVFITGRIINNELCAPRAPRPASSPDSFSYSLARRASGRAFIILRNVDCDENKQSLGAIS